MSLLRTSSRLAQLSKFQPLLSSSVRLYSTPSTDYKHILTSTPKPGVGQITLNRPKALNALSSPLFEELNDALRNFDTDEAIGAIVLTGSERAFAAGADITEMASLSFATAFKTSYLASWSTTTTSLRTPLIAAVSGYCLGGGCELAMMADIIYCTSSAKFGQPEITLGILPGAGGTQRLTRAIGKAKAMELILTGKMFSGAEAESWGLAARTFESSEECVNGAVETAAKIASFSRVAVHAAKESVNKSYEVGLKDGVEYERRLFHGMFGTKDQKIGMKAFVAKDKNPKWEHE